MPKPVRVPNIRHTVRGKYSRTTRRSRLARWLALRATALSYTAAEVWGWMKRGQEADAIAKATTSPPVGRNRPTIAGTTTSGQTLTATSGTYGGTPAGTVATRAWYRDGVVIAGATAATYVLVAGDVGKRITYAETFSNSAGSSQPNVSVPTAVVA